jgi:O-antigen/teichoic acid export membrane protein
MNPSPTASRLLSFLERITRTDLTYLIKGGSWLTVSQVITAAIALFLTIAFGHFVARDTYGTYRFLLSVFWALTALSFTGIPTAVVQAVARGFEGAYLRAFSLSLRWGLPMALASLGGSAWYYMHGNLELAEGLLVIAILGPLMQPAYFFGAYLEGKKDFRTEAILGVILAVVPAILLALCIPFTSSPIVFLVAYLAGNVGTGVFLDWYVLKRYPPNADVNPDFHSLSWHFSLMNTLSTLSQQVDKLLVFHFLGAVDLAIYTFAIALPEQLRTVLNPVTVLAFPKFAERPIAEIRKTLWLRLALFMLALTVLAGIYILLAPFLFHLLFPQYLDAVWYSRVFALSLITIGSVIPATLLLAHAAKRELYVLNTASPLFQILLLVMLIPAYGILGAVLARIIGRVASLALGGILVHRHGG